MLVDRTAGAYSRSAVDGVPQLMELLNIESLECIEYSLQGSIALVLRQKSFFT